MQKAKILCCCLLWFVSGVASAATMTIHYHRPNNDYDSWGVHLWAGEEIVNGKEVGARTDFRLRRGTTPGNPLLPTKFDDFGVAFVISVRNDAKQFSYAITDGTNFHMANEEWKWIKAKHGNEIWIVDGKSEIYTKNPLAAKATTTQTTAKAATPPPPPVAKEKPKAAPAKAPAPKVTATASTSSTNSAALKLLERELNAKQKTVNKLQSALNSAQGINRRLQNQVNEKFVEYQELLQLNDKLQSENRQLEASNKSLYRQAQQANSSEAEAQLMTRVKDLEAQLSTRNGDIEKLRNQVAQASADQAEQQQLTDQMMQIKQQRDDLRTQNEKLSAHVVELVQKAEASPKGESGGIAWWLFAAVTAILLGLIAAVCVIFMRRIKGVQEESNDLLRRKEEEIKTEKIYAAAANEKLRKVLHGEAQQRSWQSLPESFPEHLKKDAV